MRVPSCRKMSMTQSSRYLAKLDPKGFFCWLFRLSAGDFEFRGWLDTRAISFPGSPERISDMVAHLTDLFEHGIPWAMLLEFQIIPDPKMFGRLMGSLAAIWEHVKPDEERGSRFQLGAAVINLTGRGNCSQEMRWPKAQLITQLCVVERNLEFENADEMLEGVESGSWPKSLLPFIPLMIRGDEPAIIERWIALVGAESDLHLRTDYAAIALIFADRVGRKSNWYDRFHQEWKMTESPFLNEFIAKGEAKGRVEGRIEEAHSLVLRLGAKRFGKTAPAEIQTAILAIGDRERLERISERILDAVDWNDLLATT
jgi:hypothetical protein